MNQKCCRRVSSYIKFLYMHMERYSGNDFFSRIPLLHANINGSIALLCGGGWADRSKAAGKQGELGRNAGGGDKLPPGRAKKIIFFFFCLCITHEMHLFHFFKLKVVLPNLGKLSDPSSTWVSREKEH